MNWKLSFHDKVMQNPLPIQEGGYGKPLSGKLSGCCKIKLKKSGIRVIYKIERIGNAMHVIVIGLRHNSDVYKTAENRINDI